VTNISINSTKADPETVALEPPHPTTPSSLCPQIRIASCWSCSSFRRVRLRKKSAESQCRFHDGTLSLDSLHQSHHQPPRASLKIRQAIQFSSPTKTPQASSPSNANNLVGAAAVLIHLRRFLPLLPSRRRRPVLGPPPSGASLGRRVTLLSPLDYYTVPHCDLCLFRISRDLLWEPGRRRDSLEFFFEQLYRLRCDLVTVCLLMRSSETVFLC
jgi:hypothetical protein